MPPRATPAGTPLKNRKRRAQRGPGQVLKSWLRAWWDHKVPFVISLTITTAATFLYLYTFVGDRPTPLFEFVKRLELDALDTRFRYRPASYSHPDPRIVIVDIDQRSQEVLGRWPFPRAEFARALDALHDDGAAVVGFDITFSKPDEASAPILELKRRLAEQRGPRGTIDPRLTADLDRLQKDYDNDDQFARAIERFGPVALGNFFLYSQSDLEGITNKTLDDYADLLSYFPFPEVRPLDRANAKRDRIALIQDFAPYKLVPRGAQANIPVLSDALRGGLRGYRIFQRRTRSRRRRASRALRRCRTDGREAGGLGLLRFAGRAGDPAVSPPATRSDDSRLWVRGDCWL